MMRSLLVTAFALSADALDFVAVSPGTGAAYEGSLSGNGNSVGYTAANGDQRNAFIYNSSYDQSTIMITPAQVTSPHASDLLPPKLDSESFPPFPPKPFPFPLPSVNQAGRDEFVSPSYHAQ